MRTLPVVAFVLLLAAPAAAATLTVEVSRHGFTGPVELAVAPRIDGQGPEWAVTKTLAAGQSTVRFDGLAAGLYVVLASGAGPLQRLSAKANVGSDGGTIRLVLPPSQTELRATVGGEPLPRAFVLLTHRELQWTTEVRTDEEGRFAGALWEPGVYTAAVSPDALTAAHHVDVWLSPKPLTIEVPNRHVRGRVVAGGKPLGGAILLLRSESPHSTVTVRTQSAPDGRFAFFGVREGPLTLTARAVSYLDSDPVAFELRGAPAHHSVDIELTRGAPHAVRVVDARGAAMAGATLIAFCNGHVKSTSVTNSDGRAEVALRGDGASCAVCVLPEKGSIAIAPVEGMEPLLIRVPDGTSSLRLTLQSEGGKVFSAMSLLLRIDGRVVPPSVARLLATRGLLLMTNEQGTMELQRIPAGRYDFWPYRNAAEGEMLYETATEFPAPISLEVVEGENHATVKFRAR